MQSWLKNNLFLLFLFINAYSGFTAQSGIQENYKKQQKNFICNYENAQFYALSANNKFCVKGNIFQEYFSDGTLFREGILNREIKSGYGNQGEIYQYRIEGNEFVKYICPSRLNNFECSGLIKKEVIASKNIYNLQIKASQKSYRFNNRGTTKARKNDIKGAILDFTSAINLDQTNRNAYFNRGLSKFKLEDYKDAILDFTSAINLDQTFKNAYFRRGLSKFKLEDYKGAILDYTSAIKLENNNVEKSRYYNRRGFSKYKLGDYEGAVSDYTRAINSNSENGWAYSDRAYSKRHFRDYEGACEDFQMAKKILGPNKKWLDKEIWTNCFMMKDFGKGMDNQIK